MCSASGSWIAQLAVRLCGPVAQRSRRGEHASLDGANPRRPPSSFALVPFHLGEHKHDPAHRLANRRVRVEVLRDADDLASGLLNPRDRRIRFGGVSAKPVELGHDDPPGSTLLNALKQLVELGTIHRPAGHVEVSEDLPDLKVVQLGVASDLLLLNCRGDEAVTFPPASG